PPFSVPLLPQAASMLTAMTPASIREAIFLSFIMNFSSLWCIKDRDPKQVERKVLSFQRHYSIPPPGVKARFTIFWFLLSFLQFAPKALEYILNFMRYFTHIYSFVVFGAKRPEGSKKAPAWQALCDGFVENAGVCIIFVKMNFEKFPVRP